MNARILQSHGLSCYLLVASVSGDDGSPIGDLLQHLDLDCAVRLTYENTLESLITKRMPNGADGATSATFHTELIVRIALIPGHTSLSLAGIGATHYHVPGKRTK